MGGPMSYLRRAALVAGVALALGTATPAGASPAHGDWAGTWGASATGTVPNLSTGYADRTIRNVIHTSVGGSRARVELTNVLGTAPVTMSATVAVAGTAPDAVPGAMRPLTFGGTPNVTIPPGGEVLSDPVSLAVPEDGD